MDTKTIKLLQQDDTTYEQIVQIFSEQVSLQNQLFIQQLLQTREKKCIQQLSYYFISEQAPLLIQVNILEQIILFYSGLDETEEFNFKDIIILAVVCRQLNLREINVHYYIQIIIDNQLKYLQFIKNIVNYCVREKNDTYALEIFLYIHISFDTSELQLGVKNDMTKDQVCQSFKIMHCRVYPQKYELSKVIKDYIHQVCDVNQHQLTPVTAKYCNILQHIVEDESNVATSSTPKIMQKFLTSNVGIFHKLHFLSGLLPYPALDTYTTYHKIVLQDINKIKNEITNDNIGVTILYQQLINKLNILVLFLRMNDLKCKQAFIKSELNFSFQTTINRCIASIQAGVHQIDSDILLLDVLLLEDFILQKSEEPVNHNVKDKICKLIDAIHKHIDDTGRFTNFCLYYISILCQVYQYQIGDPISVPYSITGKHIYNQVNHKTRNPCFLSYVFTALLNFVNFTNYNYVMFLEVCRSAECHFDPNSSCGIFIHQRSYIVPFNISGPNGQATCELQNQLEDIQQKYNQLLDAYNKRKSVPGQSQQRVPDDPNPQLQKELENAQQLIAELNQQKTQMERQIQQLTEDKKHIQNQLSISNNNNQMFQAQLNQAQSRYDELQASKIQLQNQIERSKEELVTVKNQMHQQAEETRGARYLLQQIKHVIQDFKE